MPVKDNGQGRGVQVEMEGIDIAEMIEIIGKDVILDEIGKSDCLDHIGREACIEYFDIQEKE